MGEAREHLDRGVTVLDYFVHRRPRRAERFTLHWWDESLFTIAGTMALVVLVILPLIVVTLSVLTWMLLQL